MAVYEPNFFLDLHHAVKNLSTELYVKDVHLHSKNLPKDMNT